MASSHLFLRGSAAMLAVATTALPTTVWADSTPECNIGVNDDPGPDAMFGTPDDVQLGATECGAFSYAPGENSTAVGVSATAFNANSTAIGENSSASADNSVALGSGSEADEANTVSVGSLFQTRRITNVTGGIERSDAANFGQMSDGDAATLNDANDYTDSREAVIRTDIANSAASSLTNAKAYTDIREAQIRGDLIEGDSRIEALANAAQLTASTAIVRSETMGTSIASALGGGSNYDAATGVVSLPNYLIDGKTYSSVGDALGAVDTHLEQMDTRIDILGASAESNYRNTNGGIAAAIALGGTMIVPDSTVSVNFNLATYRGEQGFSGAVVLRAAPRIYISGGFAGSTVKGSTGGRVGMAFGF